MDTIKPLEIPQEGIRETVSLKRIDEGVCAAKGVRAAGVAAGLRKEPGRLDLSLVAADEPCVVAAVFTQNIFCAAPVQVSREHAQNGVAQAVVMNSGNANASTGEPGMAVARDTCALVASALGCDTDDVLVGSTGVIGKPLALDGFERGVPEAVSELEHSREASIRAASAVMTTDTVRKESAFEVTLDDGSVVHVGGFCKGSGMIMPNMATMLSVIACDAALDHEAAQSALKDAIKGSFNKVTVDSDTSTNDTCILLCTGKVGPAIDRASENYEAVAAAIAAVTSDLARQIAADGEGATKLVTVDVLGAATTEDAETVARSIANSPLVKCAIFGHDANWGRVAAAAGKCGVEFNQYNVDIDLLGVPVLRRGLPVPMDEEDMLRRFEGPEVAIAISLGEGDAHCRMWTCDFSHDYVTINGDYRT